MLQRHRWPTQDNILVPSLEGGKVMLSQMSISFPWQKYCCTCICKQVQDKYIPMFVCIVQSYSSIFPSAESEFGIPCKIMQWKSTRNIFQFVSSQQKQAQALLLKPLLSAVPYIPTGLSMYSSQQLLHHLYSSHISSSIQDEQTFAITWINVSQWRVFQTNLVVRKQNVQLHKCAKSLRCYRET